MVQEFRLTESEVPEGSPSYDVCHLWHDVELPGCNPDVQVKVRMVQEDIGHDREWVILDSGADLSLLPQRLRSRGKPIDVPNLQVSDAQGGSLSIRDMSRVLLSTEWDDTTGVVIQEDFAVTNVKSILLSLGKLLKKGWRLAQERPTTATTSVDNQWQRCS